MKMKGKKMAGLNPIQQFVAKECHLGNNVRPRALRRAIEKATDRAFMDCSGALKERPNLVILEKKAYKARLLKGLGCDGDTYPFAIMEGMKQIRKAVGIKSQEAAQETVKKVTQEADTPKLISVLGVIKNGIINTVRNFTGL